MNVKKLIFLILIVGILTISGCAQPIKEIKNDQYVGKEVTVSGTVKATIKLGEISGYTIVDENGDSIGVSSKSLPAEGSKKTVTGTLVKKPILGYYIEEK